MATFHFQRKQKIKRVQIPVAQQALIANSGLKVDLHLISVCVCRQLEFRFLR